MAESYLSSSEDLAAWRAELNRSGKKLVLTNGVFDLLHVGHVRYLKEARALGEALIVAINGDESVRELKGPGRPLYPAEERAEILCALQAVDRVVVFEEKRATEIIEKIHPDIYTKGGDYTPDSLIDEEKALLYRLGIPIQILSLVPGKSTSGNLAMMEKISGAPRIAVLASGTGSNCAAIIEATNSGSLNAQVALVISDVPDAPVLTMAREAGIPAIHIAPGTDRGGHLSNASLKEMQDRLTAARVDLVVLAGFMRILREPLLTTFSGRILNIHPSLLPKFPGLHACRRAIEAGEKESGCTIHLVDSGVDTGEILRQGRVPILKNDTERTLRDRIQDLEHRVYPEVIAEQLHKVKSHPPDAAARHKRDTEGNMYTCS